jgi:hypothetical protein
MKRHRVDMEAVAKEAHRQNKRGIRFTLFSFVVAAVFLMLIKAKMPHVSLVRPTVTLVGFAVACRMLIRISKRM